MQTEQTIRQSQNRELGNGMWDMRRIWMESQEWDGNEDVGNQRGNCGNLGGIVKNKENRGGNAGNQGGNLSAAVNIT